MKKSSAFLFIIFICSFTPGCSKVQDNDLNGWFKAGSLPGAYKIGVNTEDYNKTKAYFIKSTDTVTNGFGTIMKMGDATRFYGKRVKMSSYIKTVNAEKGAGMWFRIDAKEQGKMLGFDNMQTRPVKGTTDWQKCEIVLDVSQGSSQLAFGLILNNTGEACFSEPEFEVVGTDVPVTNMLVDDKSVYTKYNGWFKAGSLPNSYELGISPEKFKDSTAYYLKSITDVTQGFGTIMKTIMDIKNYLGKRLRLTGYIKNVNLDEYAGMWMRIDGDTPGKSLGFDNMFNRQIKGTNDWTKYEVVLDVPINSTSISYGVLVNRNGMIMINELVLDVVGKDVPTTNIQ